ncbi:MAG: AI-2E family transporter [Candidatus Yanofskybacteria bacterium]|nr:AI-2E family transporter [Candidatus Yanofskybacteria bacterium]
MPEHGHVHIEINTGTIVRFVLVILFFLFLYLLKDVFIIFLFALIIASAIAPFANWLEEKGLPRLLGVLILFFTVLVLVGFLLSLVVPFVSQEVSQLLTGLPGTLSKVSSSLEKAQEGAPKYFDFVSEIQNILETFSTYLQQSAQSVIGLVVSIFGGVMSFVAILIISFYLSVTKNGIDNFLGSIVPEKYEQYAIGLWKRSEVKVGRWLQGQLLLGLIMGLVVYVGLSLMGIKYALLLAFLAAVLEIGPIVGPVLAAIPAVFLAFLQGPSMGLWVVLFYVAAQQLENHLLVPVVLGKTTGLNPVVVIIALLVGQQLAGIPGMILSVPVATVIVEMLDDLAKHKELRRLSA